MTKTWIVTGASRGIGLEITRSALDAGENVVATARKREDVERALADADSKGRLLVLELDVTNALQPETVAKAAVERFGTIDVLVNNAGYGQLGFFETLTPRQLDRQYATNVFGLFNVTRAVLPIMRAQRSGHILNISSIGGSLGFGGACAYTSSKFALEGFSEDMAKDLAPFGINVTIVEPGFFRTDFLDASSIRYGEIDIDDYAEASASQRRQYDGYSHEQLGDPRKLGAALLDIVAADQPPLRFIAGTDAVQMTRENLARRLAELERWTELSSSTDHDDAGGREAEKDASADHA